jgi:chromate transport protein ChrA
MKGGTVKNTIKLVIGAVRRMGREMLYLGWTLAGTGLVLITLSSTTLKQGIYISLAGLALHLLGTVLDYVDDERENESN